MEQTKIINLIDEETGGELHVELSVFPAMTGSSIRHMHKTLLAGIETLATDDAASIAAKTRAITQLRHEHILRVLSFAHVMNDDQRINLGSEQAANTYLKTWTGVERVAEEVLLYNHITPRGTDPDDLQRYDLTGSVLGQSFTATVTGLLKDLLPHMAGLEPKEQAAN